MRDGPRRGGVLAIDHGERHSGFASADALWLSAAPLDPFHGDGSGEALLEHIARLLAEREVATVVVGLPLNADGSENPRCSEVRAFAARLSQRFPALEVVTQDEHLTSRAAEERLRAAGLRGRQARALRDSWSALVLLEDWLRSRG